MAAHRDKVGGEEIYHGHWRLYNNGDLLSHIPGVWGRATQLVGEGGDYQPPTNWAHSYYSSSSYYLWRCRLRNCCRPYSQASSSSSACQWKIWCLLLWSGWYSFWDQLATAAEEEEPRSMHPPLPQRWNPCWRQIFSWDLLNPSTSWSVLTMPYYGPIPGPNRRLWHWSSPFPPSSSLASPSCSYPSSCVSSPPSPPNIDPIQSWKRTTVW